MLQEEVIRSKSGHIHRWVRCFVLVVAFWPRGNSRHRASAEKHPVSYLLMFCETPLQQIGNVQVALVQYVVEGQLVCEKR